jgi:hypothetical protein
MANVVPPSAAMAFVTKRATNLNLHHPVKSKCKINKRQSVLKKIRLLSRLGKCERKVDICHNFRFAHSSIHTIQDSADRITESGKSVNKVLV